MGDPRHGPGTKLGALVAAVLLAWAPGAHAMLGFRAMAMGKGQRTVTAFGDGADGALNVASANTVVNSVATWLTADAPASSTQLTVNATTGFGLGDEILIVQVQGPSGVGNAEFRRVAGATATTLRFDQPLANAYTTGTFDAANAKVTQVVRVPRYTNVSLAANASIVANAWNGRTGGVVALRATGTITFNSGASISADSKGFRGPPRETGIRARNGRVGEGTLGNSRTVCVNNTTTPDTGTGGCGAIEGTFNSLDGVASAGGGANEAAMPNDGFAYISGPRFKAKGGTPYAQGNFNVLVLGGGGGQGDSGTNDWLSLAAGGNGGGIVFVSAATISNPTILARGGGGETACDYTGQGGDWGNSGGGGGAGGSIWVRAQAITGGSVNATAGVGATICTHEGQAQSDSGGGGRIRIDATTWTGTSSPAANRGTPP